MGKWPVYSKRKWTRRLKASGTARAYDEKDICIGEGPYAVYEWGLFRRRSLTHVDFGVLPCAPEYFMFGDKRIEAEGRGQ